MIKKIVKKLKLGEPFDDFLEMFIKYYILLFSVTLIINYTFFTGASYLPPLVISLILATIYITIKLFSKEGK